MSKVCKKGHEYDDGKRQCPVCSRETKAKYRENNLDRLKEKDANRYQQNRESITEHAKKYREQNRDILKQRNAEQYHKNKDIRKEYQKLYYNNNKDKARAYYDKNIESIKQKMLEYRINNKEYFYNYEKMRMENDLMFKFKKRMRLLIKNSFNRKNYSKTSKTCEALGCDFETALAHLIQTAIKNYGIYDAETTYHIDHIIPLATATTEAEVIRLCHISNLQYLTAEDNLAKGSKLHWNASASEASQ